MKTEHLLATIALGGAVLSAGCFAGAYGLTTANDSGSREVILRELPWDGSTKLSLGLEADVRFVQAEGEMRLVARGPHRSVSTLEVANGHVHDKLLHTGARLELTLFAPGVHRFRLNGTSRLVIEGFDQPALEVAAEGRAWVDAAGRAGKVTLDLQGRGAVNLARLEVERIGGRVGGTVTVIAAPRTASTIEARSSATVVLLTRPPEYATRVADAATVIDAAR